MFSDKRAITPVIATLLLIAITVAAVAGFYIFYNAFIKQSKVSGDNPSLSLSGPSTANSDDTVVISIKNSGNVDLASWSVRGPDQTVLLGQGTVLKVGSQRSFATVCPGSGPWRIRASGQTEAGSQCEDQLNIEPT